MGGLGSVLVLAVLTLTYVFATADLPTMPVRSSTLGDGVDSHDVDALLRLYAPDAILVGSTASASRKGARPSAAISPDWQRAGTRS